jgi:hypothetical protein
MEALNPVLVEYPLERPVEQPVVRKLGWGHLFKLVLTEFNPVLLKCPGEFDGIFNLTYST